jgi:hypothetical protein
MLMRKSTFLLTAMLVILFSNVYASHPQQYKLVNGIAIYLTIMPAEMLRGHSKEHPESDMHPKARVEGANQHHIVVSLFDAKNGDRLQNAIIKAKVSGINFEGPVRKLELMVMGGIRSYGNFFNMPFAGTYQVDLDIQTEGKNEVIKVIFQYASI